jgi:protein-disulfide isomerase
LQDRFWEMHDALFADTARLEDPHLWDRARALALDLERFDADRHSDAVRERVKRDFRSGVRAGVVTTPTAFLVEPGGSLRTVAVTELETAVARG